MIKTIFDVSTGEVTEAQLSTDEIAFIEESESQRQAVMLVEQARIDAKNSALAKLLALGLTEDEANSLLGI